MKVYYYNCCVGRHLGADEITFDPQEIRRDCGVFVPAETRAEADTRIADYAAKLRPLQPQAHIVLLDDLINARITPEGSQYPRVSQLDICDTSLFVVTAGSLESLEGALVL